MILGVDNKAHKDYCSEGLYFNEELQMCDKEENVDCEKTDVNPTPDTNTPTGECRDLKVNFTCIFG